MKTNWCLATVRKGENKDVSIFSLIAFTLNGVRKNLNKSTNNYCSSCFNIDFIHYRNKYTIPPQQSQSTDDIEYFCFGIN